MRRTKYYLLLAIILMIISLAGCKFVTVVKLGEASKQQFYYEDKDFDAGVYVKDTWPQIQQYAEQNAAPMDEVFPLFMSDPAACGEKYGYRPQSEGASYNFIVKGKAKVLGIDASSKAGKMQIDLPPYDGEMDFAMQIGTVYKGTSVRDAMPFISFENFRNQLTFGDVGKMINTYIHENVVTPASVDTLQNKEISFIGAFSEGQEILMVPIQIRAEE